MSGQEELPEAGGEGEAGEGEEFEEEVDDAELAQMQADLDKAEQQKAELDKLNKMQGGAAGAAAGKDAGGALLNTAVAYLRVVVPLDPSPAIGEERIADRFVTGAIRPALKDPCRTQQLSR
jgi:hypothetical protein